MFQHWRRGQRHPDEGSALGFRTAPSGSPKRLDFSTRSLTVPSSQTQLQGQPWESVLVERVQGMGSPETFKGSWHLSFTEGSFFFFETGLCVCVCVPLAVLKLTMYVD